MSTDTKTEAPQPIRTPEDAHAAIMASGDWLTHPGGEYMYRHARRDDLSLTILRSEDPAEEPGVRFLFADHRTGMDFEWRGAGHTVNGGPRGVFSAGSFEFNHASFEQVSRSVVEDCEDYEANPDDY